MSVAVTVPMVVLFSATAKIAGEVNAGASFTAFTARLTPIAALSTAPSFAT